MANELEIKEISDGVADELFRLAETKGYPINPYVGLDGFVESFKSLGISVDLNVARKMARFHLNSVVGGVKYYTPVDQTYQQIINGSGQNVRSSCGAFLDSAVRIFLSTENCLYRNYNVRLNGEQRATFVDNFSENISPVFVSALASLWIESFRKYHEYVLISPEGEISELKESKILSTVLDHVDWDEYDEILRRDVDNGRETKAFSGWFNILFLQELANTRGYPLKEISCEQEYYDPVDLFVDGKEVVWRNLPSFV